MIPMKDILALCPEIEENYRQLHQIPERGFEEFKTSQFILEKLAEYGIEAKQAAVTGVFATIDGYAPGRTIAIRADMDALFVTELADVPYRSRHEGRMHACGHDAHVAMLLGAARYLSAHRDQFRGRVRLIF